MHSQKSPYFQQRLLGQTLRYLLNLPQSEKKEKCRAWCRKWNLPFLRHWNCSDYTNGLLMTLSRNIKKSITADFNNFLSNSSVAHWKLNNWFPICWLSAQHHSHSPMTGNLILVTWISDYHCQCTHREKDNTQNCWTTLGYPQVEAAWQMRISKARDGKDHQVHLFLKRT